MAAVVVVFAPEISVAVVAGGAALIGIIMAITSDVPAKIRQWINDNSRRFQEDMKKEDPDREPTPVTNPPLFAYSSIKGKKVATKVRMAPSRPQKCDAMPIGSVWDADLLHGNHYEVYLTKKDFEKGRRCAAYWVDGRLKELLC